MLTVGGEIDVATAAVLNCFRNIRRRSDEDRAGDAGHVREQGPQAPGSEGVGEPDRQRRQWLPV